MGTLSCSKGFSSAIVGTLLLAWAPAAAQCPNTIVTGDQELWAAYPNMAQTYYRDMVADFYNLKKGDWDEGWGWVKYNDADAPKFALPKMMSAGTLLWGGLNDTLHEGIEVLAGQGAWISGGSNEGALTNGEPYPQMQAVSRAEQKIDLVYRASDGQLIHLGYTGPPPWHPGTLPGVSARTLVSDAVADEKNTFRISGPPILTSPSGSALNVFARQDNTLLHFSWAEGVNWAVELPTLATRRPAPVNASDRYFIATEPVLLRHNSQTLSLFALDNFKHLIHYYWDVGVWIVEDPTEQLQITDQRMQGDPVPVRRSDGTIDVFGRSQAGMLLRYTRSPSGIWSFSVVVEATAGLAVNQKLDGQPAVVSPDGLSLLVYYRSGWSIYLLAWTSITGWVRLEAAHDFAVATDPVVVRRGQNRVHGFVRDSSDRLIHFYFMPGGFGAERVGTWAAADNPTVVIPYPERVDVFVLSINGHLLHYYWTEGDREGWRAQDITLDIGVSSEFGRIAPGRIALARAGTSLEVFAQRLGFSNNTVRFASALGPTLGPWHTNTEYSEWASGGYHDFPYTPGNTNDSAGNASRVPLSVRVEMRCPAFKGTPADRASTMLHEATHMNYSTFWNFFSHQNEPGCVKCDKWFFHWLREPGSELTTSHRNHSMFQLEIEYLTDLGQFANSWIPLSVTTDAQSTARLIMNEHILNPPGWSPGSPRPLQ